MFAWRLGPFQIQAWAREIKAKPLLTNCYREKQQQTHGRSPTDTGERERVSCEFVCLILMTGDWWLVVSLSPSYSRTLEQQTLDFSQYFDEGLQTIAYLR